MRSRLALLTAVAALAAALFALPGTDAAGPPTIVVDPDGKATPQSCNARTPTPHTTIQSAVAAASANWVVKVCPGTYNDIGSISLPVGKPGLAIRGPRPQDARNRRLPDTREAVITGVNSQFLLGDVGQKVEGLAFQGTLNPVVATGTDAARVAHNLFVDTNGVAVQFSGLGAGGNLIEKNRFIGRLDGSSSHAISVGGVGRVSIKSNGFEKIDDDAVFLNSASNTTVEVNRVVNIGQFVTIISGSNIRIASNTLLQTSDPNVPVLVAGPWIQVTNSGPTSNVTIDRNRMAYPVSDGITVSEGGANSLTGIVILSNSIDNAAGAGISVLADEIGAVALRSNVTRRVIGNGINVGAAASGNTLDRNVATGSFGFDCYDGAAPGANTWTNNRGRTRSPATICR